MRAFQLVLTQEVANEAIGTLKVGASAQRLQKLRDVESRLAALYRRVEELTGTDAGGNMRPPDAGGARPASTPLMTARKEIVELMASLCEQPFIACCSIDKSPRGPTTVEQAEDKVRSLVELVSEKGDEPNKFSQPWVQHGCKRDVPDCACYVGHYRGCQGEMYVWVSPDQAKTLRDFILIILSLVPPDVQEMAAPRLGIGAANSPNF